MRSNLVLARTLALFTSLALVALTPGSAAAYTDSGGTTYSDPTPAPGQSITISGTTDPFALVEVAIYAEDETALWSVGGDGEELAAASFELAQGQRTLLGSTTADGAGAYSLTVPMPSTLTAGDYLMEVAANSIVISLTTVSVSAPAGTGSGSGSGGGSGGGLPATGANTGVLLAIAAAVLFAGVTLTRVARNRSGRVIA